MHVGCWSHVVALDQTRLHGVAADAATGGPVAGSPGVDGTGVGVAHLGDGGLCAAQTLTHTRAVEAAHADSSGGGGAADAISTRASLGAGGPGAQLPVEGGTGLRVTVLPRGRLAALNAGVASAVAGVTLVSRT